MVQSYESAPGTKLLAVECACCGRPLLDAASIEAGMGPHCRKNHGFVAPDTIADLDAVDRIGLAGTWPSDPKARVNALVHHIAAKAFVGADLGKAIATVHALGFQKLADRLAERTAPVIQVQASGDYYYVRAPFSEVFNIEMRDVRGSVWIPADKVRRVPVTARVALWDAIKRAFPGAFVATGNKLVRIPGDG